VVLLIEGMDAYGRALFYRYDLVEDNTHKGRGLVRTAQCIACPADTPSRIAACEGLLGDRKAKGDNAWILDKRLCGTSRALARTHAQKLHTRVESSKKDHIPYHGLSHCGGKTHNCLTWALQQLNSVLPPRQSVVLGGSLGGFFAKTLVADPENLLKTPIDPLTPNAPPVLQGH